MEVCGVGDVEWICGFAGLFGVKKSDSLRGGGMS